MNNQCRDTSTCTDSAISSGQILNVDDGSITQEIDQNNRCFVGSNCANSGNTFASVDNFEGIPDDQKKHQTQTIHQNNLCIGDSICSNTGSVNGESGSNSQSNTCIDGSNCNNSGENNKTICIGSVNCENIGTDTKVISKGQDCSSGDPGSTTVSANGLSITS